ncbi:MAG: hypothetical protein WDZ30_02715 [Cellvibrionaceae bacterium]
MKRLSMGALLSSVALSVSAAECIQVKEKDFSLASNDIGSAVVQWKAELKNECRKTLDADLVILLLDNEAKPVYELLDKATFGVEESLGFEKEVYVPSRILGKVESFTIQVRERERLQ